MIVFAFLESSGMSKVLIHHSDGSSLTTTLINRFFTWNIGMAFSTVEPGSFQGISRIRQKKAWNRYIFIRKQFLALHRIIIHFNFTWNCTPKLQFFHSKSRRIGKIIIHRIYVSCSRRMVKSLSFSINVNFDLDLLLEFTVQKL